MKSTPYIGKIVVHSSIVSLAKPTLGLLLHLYSLDLILLSFHLAKISLSHLNTSCCFHLMPLYCYIRYWPSVPLFWKVTVHFALFSWLGGGCPLVICPIRILGNCHMLLCTLAGRVLVWEPYGKVLSASSLNFFYYCCPCCGCCVPKLLHVDGFGLFLLLVI